MIRVLGPADATAYRTIRLESLQESPDAFLTTYESELNKPIHMTAENLVPSPERFTMGLFEDTAGASESPLLIAIATIVRETNEKTAHKANLYGMYVRPNLRGHGFGHALLSSVISRARQMPGLEQINLTVMHTNEAAKQLYASCGFVVFGTEERAIKFKGQYWDEDFLTLRLT